MFLQSGRSTLEWTIKEIQSHPEWKAKVVYGDTDSVFVLLKGRSREQVLLMLSHCYISMYLCVCALVLLTYT